MRASTLLRGALVVVLPSACTTTTTALDGARDAGGTSDLVQPGDVPAYPDVPPSNATDTSPINVNPPPPKDVPWLDVVDVTDTLSGSEIPPLPGDAPDASSLDVSPPPDGSPPPDAPPTDSGCLAGQRFCGGRCVDVGPHANACTPCGLPCCAGGFCTGGSCSVGCAPGTYVCPSPNPSPRCEGGICVDLRFDLNNCGRCGLRCLSGQRCQSGECTP